MPKALARAVRTEREKRKLSVAQLSTRSGVSRAMIDEIERGKNVSVDTLLKLAPVLGLTALPLDDERAVVLEGAKAKNVRLTAERIWHDALEIIEAVTIADAERDGRAARVIPFPQQPGTLRIIFADEDAQAEALRTAFESSADAEYRRPFKGKAKHLVRRGIDVAAGHGAELLSRSEEEGELREIPQHYWEIGARNVLRATGFSLIGRGIVDRDLLFIKPTQEPDEGKVIVCRVNNLAYVKIFHRASKDRIELLSSNPSPEYKTIAVEAPDTFQCFGIVVGRSGYPLPNDYDLHGAG